MYRGYLQLNNQEIANSSRVVDHLRPAVGEDCTSCRRLQVRYDDTWTGLHYDAEAPWLNAAVDASSEFVGVWPMDVRGLDAVPVQRDVVELVCAGGAAPRPRDTSRTIEVDALVVGCTNRGARYGLQWLACQLRQATARNGVELSYYAAHPEDTGVDPDTLWRSMRGIVLAVSPTVTEYAGLDGRNPHRQASVLRVGWTMVALNPYAYALPETIAVEWDSTSVQGIEWAHAPDCQRPEDCALPTLFAAGCEPERVDLAPAAVPICGGCLPVCEVERRTWVSEAVPASCLDTTASLRVTNRGELPLTLNMYWRPVGDGALCNRIGEVLVNGLDSNATAVADSVGGRPYAIVDGQRVRQIGVVTTPRGAPWGGMTIDRGLSWELVAESAPGALYDLSVTFQDRDS